MYKLTKSLFQERRQAQHKIEELHSELVDKEKEIEQLKYKLKFKVDELEREKHERAEEVMVLTHEIENLKYMKNAAISQFDEHTNLLKQIEIMKKVRIKKIWLLRGHELKKLTGHSLALRITYY